MGLFDFIRKEKVVDLSERYKKQQENLSSNSNEGEYADFSKDIDEKKRRLAKRLSDMTNKIEELSNQIYHLQQRIEVLERKAKVGFE